jgi:hydroxymethylglutaryl-CoA synthase
MMSDYSNGLLKPDRPVGIVGYGAYVPRYRLPATEISRMWKGGTGGTPIEEKAVNGLDEDVVTMSIEAARRAAAAQIDPREIRAVWVGSESHPYAVKPSSTIVAEAIGAVPNTQAADWEFACKAGTEAMQAAMGFVGSGMARYALSIGMDTAQGRPGDALEYTAAAGGAAMLIGPGMKPWRSSTAPTPSSPTRPTSGGASTPTTRRTATASPANRPISSTSWARPKS